MAEKLITKSFERLLDKGKYRGFITYEELGKSLGKRNSTHENIERALIILVDEKVTLVEKKSQYQSNKKKETSNQTEEKTSDKSDDPIRMYLREMGGVELLSREGEIAIAISPSLDNSSTPPISLRYILIGSSLLSEDFSSVWAVASFFLFD